MVEMAYELGTLQLRYKLPSHKEPLHVDYINVDDSYFSGIPLSSTPVSPSLAHQTVPSKRDN